MDGKKLENIARLFGSARGLAKALKISPASITRRIGGEIAISERDKHNINLTIDERVKQLTEAKL